ncbi:MAG: thiamine pyrophosphate-dependent dehydrogenase E1 component subunit alpha [Chloroflexota bacterium]|nr:thiamine pyrophosphate-dependent dehydrogenase E1 component subunit alpha [Chloroflexota bacterium]
MQIEPITHRNTQLSQQTLLKMYWDMQLSRRLDERAWAIHRQGRIAFHISAIGHEAAQVAAAYAIHRGVDFVAPYYRDLTLMLALGMTPVDFLMSLFGKRDEIGSGGRQMPSHFNNRALNVVSTSAVVATQVPQAAGLAFAIQYKQRCGLVDPNDTAQPRLALTCLGEGSTSQGEWHEAMNWAGVHKLPFICLVQNNVYAISMRVDQQMAVRNVADRATAYGVHGITVDGTDVLAMYDAMSEAVQRAYSGEGATLVEAKCYRITPHSSDDDDRTYRSREEVEQAKARDPLLRFRQFLLQESILTDTAIEEYDERAKAVVEQAQIDAEAAPYPEAADAAGAVYKSN